MSGDETPEQRLLRAIFEQPTTCPAHGPLDESGGCAGCVADDRATDAWEGA